MLPREHAKIIKAHSREEEVLTRIGNNYEEDPEIDAESWKEETDSPLEIVEELDNNFIQIIGEQGKMLNELDERFQSIDESSRAEETGENYERLEEQFQDILDDHNEAFHQFYDTEEEEWLKPHLVYKLLEKGPEGSQEFVEDYRENLGRLEDIDSQLEDLEGPEESLEPTDTGTPGDDTGDYSGIEPSTGETGYTPDSSEEDGYELGLMEKITVGMARVGDFLNYGGDDR